MNQTLDFSRTAMTRLGSQWTQDAGEYVVALEWSPDGSLLAAATSTGSVSLFKPTGKVLQRFEAHGFGLNTLRWSPNGWHLATGGQDGRAHIYDPRQGKLLAELSGGSAWIEHLAWSPDSGTLATAAGKHLRLWDLDGTLQHSFPAHPNTISALEWRKQAIFVACYGGVRLWRAGGELPETSFDYAGAPVVMALSPNAEVVCIGCQDQCIHLWYTATGQDLEMYGYATKPRALAWDATGRFLATTGGAEVTIWDFAGAGPSGSTPAQLIGHDDLIHDIAYQPNSGLLASACQDGSLYLWKPRPAEQTAAFAFGLGTASAVKLAWRPGARAVAVGYANGQVALWATPSA